MRLFLAINFPSVLRDAIHVAAAPLREAGDGAVAWVAADRLHLTVKFLGEQPEDAVERLRGALADATRRHSAVPVAIGGVGAFPNFRRARVVWIGVAPEPRLELLHHDVEARCAEAGFEVEGRAFRPHLTLGRVRGSAPEAVSRALARAARGVQFHETAIVSAVDLMQSTLLPEGSRYDVVASAALGGR